MLAQSNSCRSSLNLLCLFHQSYCLNQSDSFSAKKKYCKKMKSKSAGLYLLWGYNLQLKLIYGKSVQINWNIFTPLHFHSWKEYNVKVLESCMRNIKEKRKILLKYKGPEYSKEDKKFDTSVFSNRNSSMV